MALVPNQASANKKSTLTPPRMARAIILLAIYPLLGRDEVTRTNRGAEGIGGRVKFLPLAWAGMPKTSFRKNSDSPQSFP
jgi:hypothetical protein